MSAIRFGPIVWYGVDGHRSGDWKIVFEDHFIVAHAPGEEVKTDGWTDHERTHILGWRWWRLDELRASDELIYPFNLAERLEPILSGNYPSEIVVLPPI